MKRSGALESRSKPHAEARGSGTSSRCTVRRLSPSVQQLATMETHQHPAPNPRNDLALDPIPCCAVLGRCVPTPCAMHAHASTFCGLYRSVAVAVPPMAIASVRRTGCTEARSRHFRWRRIVARLEVRWKLDYGGEASAQLELMRRHWTHNGAMMINLFKLVQSSLKDVPFVKWDRRHYGGDKFVRDPRQDGDEANDKRSRDRAEP